MMENQDDPPAETGEADVVGYGRPPKAHRFEKGRSGNPRGRPKGARGHKQIVERVAFERHLVREGKAHLTRTSIELVFLALRKKVADGNPQMLKLFEDLLARYAEAPPEERGGYLVVPGSITAEEWDRLMQSTTVDQSEETT